MKCWNRLVIIGALMLSAFAVAFAPAQDQEKSDPVKFFTGANRTPVPKIVEAIKGGKAAIYRAIAAPAQVITVPKRLSMWGNSQYGCCVTSESVFAIADYSTFIGGEEIFVTEATAIAWARAHGVLNGADLLSVIQDMQADGIKDEGGVLRKAGKPSAVDYSNEDTLKSAIAQGPVSIAIDSSALPSGAGNKSGWSAFGGRSYPNTDHCVGLHGYGATADLFKALNVSAPAGAPANGYFIYTWNTIGVVDHKWLMNTCVEAWVRNPTIVGLDPPPPPPVTDIAVSVANVAGGVGVPVKFGPSAKGGTSPYIFLFDYGDSFQDASASHSYKTAGTYNVTVTAIDSTGKTGTASCLATIGSVPPPPIPGGIGLRLNQDTKAGDYLLIKASVLDELQPSIELVIIDDESAAHNVTVPVEILGHAVQDNVGAEGEGLLKIRSHERVVDD